MNMRKEGSAWLNDQMIEHASTEVVYRHGATSLAILASFGKTQFQVTNQSDMLIEVNSFDFLFDSQSLGLVPEKGHEIDANGKTYQVHQFDPKQQPFRYCDPFEHRIRVHTRLKV